MRIHFFILRLDQHGGGSNQNAAVFIRGLKALGHSVVVHTFSENNDPPGEIEIRRERHGGSFRGLLKQCAKVMSLVERDTDVFFVYGQALVWGAGMYRKSGAKPVAVYLDSHLDTMSGAFRPYSLMHRWKHTLWEMFVGRRLIRSIDAFFAVSPYLMERYMNAGFPKEKLSVIPNAFDFQEMNLLHNVRDHILYVGRLSYEKGVDVLLHAFALIKNTALKLKIVGEGVEREKLQNLIRSLGIVERVELSDWKYQKDLFGEYASAAALVVPSRVREPFGRTIVEAMHEGTPVIVPKTGGSAWAAGDAGVTFENGNARSLSEALQMLMKDEALRREMGEKGRSRAAEFHSENVCRQLALELERIRSTGN